MRTALSFLTALILTFQAYSQTRDEQGFRFINEMLQKDPKNAELLFFRGLAFSEIQKYDSAIADLTDALKYLRLQTNAPIFHEDKPADSADIIHMRAHCYEMTNAISKSVEDYRYMQKAKPDDFMYSIAVARIYIKHKDFVNAQIEIDRLKKFQENERGLVYQAILFNEMEDNYQAALTAIDIALNKYPGSIEGLVTKGKILGKLGKEAEACKTATEAKSKITPDHFGGQRGYLREFEREIENQKSLYCK